MSERDYYPAMTDSQWRNAPFNEPAPNEDKEFDVTVSQTLSKNTTTITNDYIKELVEDEDGKWPEINTESIDWQEAYNEWHDTPLGLMKKFKIMMESMLENKDFRYANDTFLKYNIKECENWIEDDFEVIEG